MRQRQSKAQEADIGNLSTQCHHVKKREKTREKAKHHPTNSEVQRIINDIRSLRDNGKTDIEIRETLGLELRTYQKYIHNIHEEEKNVWFSITQQEMAGTLLRLRSSLNHSYLISKKMSEDETADISDRLEALATKDNSLVDLAKLLLEGPEMLRQVQTQLPHIETKPYVEKYDWRKNGERVLNETE